MKNITKKEIIEKLSHITVKSDSKWENETLTYLQSLKDNTSKPKKFYGFIIVSLSSLKNIFKEQLFYAHLMTFSLIFLIPLAYIGEITNNSLPGEPLFAIDKAWEKVERELETEDYSRTIFELESMDERIEEYYLLQKRASNEDNIQLAIEEIKKQEERVDGQIKEIDDIHETDRSDNKNKLINKYKKQKQQLKKIEKDDTQLKDSKNDYKLMKPKASKDIDKLKVRRRPRDKDRDGSVGNNGSNDGEGQKPRQGWDN